MSNSRSFLSKQSIALLSLVISVIATFDNCQQHADIQRLQADSNAFVYRPLLRVSQPVKLQISPKNLRLELATFSDTTDIMLDIGLVGDIVLSYDSSVSARLVGVAWSDTVIGEPVLRSALCGLASGEKEIQFLESDDFYLDRFVPAGDSLTIQFEHVIARRTARYAVVHMLFLYENEAGRLFDTYYWGRYELHDVVVSPKVTADSTGLRHRISFSKKDIASLEDSNESSYIYRFEESEAIWRAIGDAQR